MTDYLKKRRADQYDLDTNDDWVGPKRNEIDHIENSEISQIDNDNTCQENQLKKRKSF
jgi:hypothetical protein